MTRIVFMGTPEFAVPSLKALADTFCVVAVVTQPDRPAGRSRELTPSPVKLAAEGMDLPVLQPPTLNDPEVVLDLRALRPIIFVVAAYGEILKPELLTVPPLGSLNLHASLLPKYRGASPISAAILEGEAETGVTVMLMDADMDTGPILAQLAVPIHFTDTTESLGARLARQGAALLLETVPKWIAGEIVPRSQDPQAATYARPIKKSDGLIDWAKPAQEIDRQWRAYQPWPGAYTFWDDKRLLVLRARRAPGSATNAPPGTILKHDQGLGVATGKGILLIEEVQLAGKRAMSSSDFARGQQGFIGSRLGGGDTEQDETAQD